MKDQKTLNSLMPYDAKRMPYAQSGTVVGLFGGSFNPPHEGHVLVAQTAIKRLNLHKLWWMVTPGNPLKQRSQLPTVAERLQQSAKLVASAKIQLTGFEASISSRFSAETLAYILKHNSGVRFVWIVGADSLMTFHRWRHWRDIAEKVPVAVVDRPLAHMAALSSPFARTYKAYRIDENDAARLAFCCPPAWCYLHGPRSAQSSTAIRASTAIRR